MSLVAGSYERFIWGYKLNRSLTLTPLFSFPSHLSTIKTVAVAGTVAVSGGNDDCVKIYDLASSSEVGSFHHSASVTSVAFYSPPSLSSLPRNLLAADADGSVSIYDADPFVLLKSVKIHKKSINSMSVHPSGKIALTVGHDQCMALVNLVRGRRSFYCKIGKEASLVQFDESGDRFSMVVDEKVSIHEAEDAKLIVELDNTKKVLCAASGANGILYTGGEDRNISAWDTASGKLAYSIENAHAARVKGIVVLSKSSADSRADNPYIVASASSDGVIRVWDVRKAADGKPLSEVHTKSRLTCLAGSSIRSLKLPPNEKPNTDENLDAAVES
ncbi:p21-activated protein kinase-interacting protein 1-like [Salvia splendens]|uniref:p21-activated protein kinase-interacting protein 1-like n=1 Tax=Salvia splendens TaxID=180675 RepID=UPI001C2794EB|nr:p21-activated protein kinase-interacting protein 1-like [Salvia splendens]